MDSEGENDWYDYDDEDEDEVKAKTFAKVAVKKEK